MPRVNRARTASNRMAIQAHAARLLRERGPGVSVADVMSAAGLTHGGFYGHFESKDALLADACELAFAEALARWRGRVAGHADRAAARAALVDGYLSAANRNAAACPMATLCVDVAREDPGKPVRRAFAAGLARLIGVLAAAQDGHGAREDRKAALGQLATLVGSMVLARATRGHPISNEFLAAGRRKALDTGRARRPSRRPPSA